MRIRDGFQTGSGFTSRTFRQGYRAHGRWQRRRRAGGTVQCADDFEPAGFVGRGKDYVFHASGGTKLGFGRLR